VNAQLPTMSAGAGLDPLTASAVSGVSPDLAPMGVVPAGGARGGGDAAARRAAPGQSGAAQDMKKSLGEKALLGENDRRCY
jgi:hypothetical protein